MRDVFSPLFLTTVFLLFLGNWLGIVSYPLLPLVWLASAFSLGFFVLRKYALSYCFCVLSISLLLLFAFCREKERHEEIGRRSFPQDAYISISGILLDYPEIERDAMVLIIRANGLALGDKKWAGGLTCRIRVKGNKLSLNRGDLIIIDAQLFPAGLHHNFFRNPFADYLLCRGIHVQGFCKSAELILVEKKSSAFWRFLGRWRDAIRRVIEKKHQKNGELGREGVFLEATLLGDRGRLDDRIEEELISSGVLHLIAISGANIGIIAIFCLYVFKAFKLRMRLRYGATSVILLVFLAVSGFDVSAQRAVFMALLVFSARLFFHGFAMTNMIALSGMVMLAVNPAYFLDPGFILTYALTYALVMGRLILGPYLRWRSRFFKELVMANVSAAVFSLPLSLHYFQRYSFAGLVSGLILVPLTSLITAASLLLIPFALAFGFIADLALWALDPVLKLFFAIASFLAGLHLEIFRASPSILIVFFLLLLLAMLALVRLPKSIEKALFVPPFLLLLLLPVIGGSHCPANLEVYFLDVGQGDCELLVFPGGQSLLVDGGGGFLSDFKVGKRLVLPFILQKRIHVDWVALTHFHPDHVAGALEIIPKIKPREIWIASAPEGNPYYQLLLQTVPRKCRIVKVEKGFKKTIAGCTVEVVHPQVLADGGRVRNNDSMVLRVTDGRHSFFLAGDIEKEVEGELLASDVKLPADVLKVGHHGSANSTSFDFLHAVKPELAVMSYSANNSFGFPHPQVLANLKRLKVPWLSTARRGGICVISQPNSLQIEVSK